MICQDNKRLNLAEPIIGSSDKGIEGIVNPVLSNRTQKNRQEEDKTELFHARSLFMMTFMYFSEGI
jgi:hypothetical protein